MTVLHTVLWFLVAIGILVVVHEFGHYLAARLAGVKVLRFSVGFGRPLLSRRFGRDRTEWTLAALPLGGYVKMLDEREGEVPAAEAHRSFNRATWGAASASWSPGRPPISCSPSCSTGRCCCTACRRSSR